MCRSIKRLYNIDPPVSSDEVYAASLQFVRKIVGTTKPSRTNAEAFLRAADEIAAASERLLDSLVAVAPPQDREVAAAKARERYRERETRVVRV